MSFFLQRSLPLISSNKTNNITCMYEDVSGLACGWELNPHLLDCDDVFG